MSNPRPQLTHAQEEAAEWLSRLGDYPISTQTVREFRDWRDDPVNDAAYVEAEAFWEASGKVAADPEIMRMTAAALNRKPRRTWRAWFALPAFRITLLVASLFAVGLGVALYSQAFPTYRTGPGEQRTLLLSDGSRVQLNVDSEVRVRFSAHARSLTLARGEAFFDVAHDTTRPFTVSADGTWVRAVGTKFDVRRRDAATQVTLVEGRVQVRHQDQAQGWTLAPNETLTVSRAGAGRPTLTDARSHTSWTTGRLNFQKTLLGDAVAEINRYGKVRVALEGADLPDLRLSGYFDVGDTEAFVSGVALLFDLERSPAKDGVITLRARRTAGA